MPLPANGGAEWIEIRNYRSRPVDLQGFTLTRGTQTYTIEATLIVPPGGHVILAGANDPFIQPDHVYTGWSLGGAAGTVILGFEGMPVHAVSWSNAVEGIAMQLPGHAQIRGRATTLASELCAASTTYDGANLGTPGGASDCRIHGYLVDFFSDVPFIDIRDSGTSLPTLVADTAAAAIPGGIGFTMPFFSGTVTDLWANSNGLVGLSGTTNTTAANRNLTNTTTQTNGLIAAFWDDLTMNDAPIRSGFHYDRQVINGMQVTILQWSRYKVWAQPGEITFQAQLWENGDIVIAFEQLRGVAQYYGSAATVGIEAVGGTPEIQYLYNQAILRPHQSLLFAR